MSSLRRRTLGSWRNEAGAKTSGDMFAKAELETQLKAEAAGLDGRSLQAYSRPDPKALSGMKDIAAAMKRAEAERRRCSLRNGKKPRREIRKEVEADIKQRPDVAADLLVAPANSVGSSLAEELSAAG